MTTIAWDGKSLAADRMVTIGDSVAQYERKLLRFKDGAYGAGSGDMFQVFALMEYLNGGEPPKKLENVCYLLFRDGALYEYEDSILAHRHRRPETRKIAIGSGWQWAAAAMDFGASARDAVKYAATRDSSTGGRIDVVHIL